MRTALAALAAILSFPGLEARAEPLVQRVEEHRNDVGEIEKRQSDFLHRSSGFAFPGHLAEMPARKTYTYGPGDAEVYYTLYGGGNGDAWLSLYVYPAKSELLDHEKAVEAPILERFRAVRSEQPAELPPAPVRSAEGWYRGVAEGNEVLTGYRIVKSGNWFIKARISIPVAGGEPAMTRAMDAIAAIPWAWGQRPTTAAPASGHLGSTERDR